MNVSEFIFEFFANKGVDTAFMVTGGQAMFLNDAIGRNKKYKIICSHHEQATTMAADAYGRIKNRPAIALVTAGPGAINAMNGVVGGYTDSAPMIVISGHTNLNFVQYQNKTNIRQYGVQGINIGPLVENVVKYFVSLDDLSMVRYHLERAYEEATTGRPGPVWIEVPLDVQKSSINLAIQKNYKSDDYANQRDNISVVKSSLEKLFLAKRPIILAGQGVSLAGARKEFTEFIEQLKIPVLTARLGIDLLPTDHELYVGRPGNYGERSANFAIQNSDFILSIGCRLASSLVGHSPKEFGKHAFKIMVDVDAEELNKPGVELDMKIQMDCKEYLTEAIKLLDNKKADTEKWNEQCAEWKRKYPVCLDEYKEQNPVNSYYFIDCLSRMVDKDTMITVDTGSCFHVACQVWKVKEGQRFLTTGGISSMGYWCASIGACMAHDRKKTIVITGDGSFQMNIQELAVVKHNNLPIKIFVLNNNGYLLIRHTQHNFMEDRFIGESPESGVWCPDTMKIAKAYGIKGVKIEKPEEVYEKLKEVLDYEGPVLCEVITPEWQLLIPRVASDKLSDGTLVSREYSDMFPYLSREEYRENMIAE